MLFNSYPFILGFLPVVLLGYAALSESRWRGATPWFLIVASLFFYAWWNWRFLPLFLFSIAFNYLCGRMLGGGEAGAAGAPSPRRQAVLAMGIAVNLALLGYFKYRDFLVGSVNGVVGTHAALLHMALPLAISFFTFEQVTYLMSCYRGEAGTGDFVSYAMFITFFPHLIAGPIVRYREIYPQFNRRSDFRLLADNLAPGLMIFAIGLFKKVILADTFRDYVGPVYEAHFLPSFADAWGGTLAFGLQVYFDFSGYSDMAIGLARMLGVRFPENFDSPYQCTNMIDYWRRWHITLSFFLRDYVYIPLGGNRKGEIRQQLNLFLTMLAGGLWHGANWTFVVWGALQGAALSINHAWRKRGHRLPSLAGWALTMGVTLFGYVFFRSASFTRAWEILRGMLGFNGFAWRAEYGSFTREKYHDIVLGTALVLFCPNRQTIMQWNWVGDYGYALAFTVLAAISVLNLANPPAFVYFQF
ncbi:MAG TPA: MBOAT family O-acyltransferase [Candidatus Binataceae bacterium]|nr:MBOAT family O-acyltransferase [Candidatus Binataceae bacterium]